MSFCCDEGDDFRTAFAGDSFDSAGRSRAFNPFGRCSIAFDLGREERPKLDVQRVGEDGERVERGSLSPQFDVGNGTSR
jgi:hypothetical protein